MKGGRSTSPVLRRNSKIQEPKLGKEDMKKSFLDHEKEILKEQNEHALLKKELERIKLKVAHILTKKKQENNLFLTKLKKALSQSGEPAVFQRSNPFISKNFNEIVKTLREQGYNFGDQQIKEQQVESNSSMLSNNSVTSKTSRKSVQQGKEQQTFTVLKEEEFSCQDTVKLLL